MAESGVRFIRVHGRVIPIHDKGHSTESIAGGAAIAAASGAVAARIHHNAAHLENKGRVAVEISKNAGLEGFAKHVHSVGSAKINKAQKMFKVGHEVRVGGAAVGAALIGSGVHSALKKTKLNEKEKGAIATGSGLASYFVVRSAYAKSIAGKSMKTFDALKHAASRVARRGFKI